MLPKSQRHDFFIFIFLFFLGGLMACNYTEQGDKASEDLVRAEMSTGRMNEHDGAFLMQCGAASLKIMEIARLGTRSTNEKLVELANETAAIHQELYNEALELGQNKSVSLPVLVTESDKLEIQKFAGENASDFESRFNDLLLREQNYMLEAAQRFRDDAQDSDVRAFARLYHGRVSELIERTSALANK